VDHLDACPDKAGAPSADKARHGCPGLVEMKGNQIVILKPVFFATNKDRILEKSFPVLEAVASALEAMDEIKKLRIEGHTDDRGRARHNMQLSQRRAESVVRWLSERGISPSRLEAQGFGQERPVDTNKTSEGRAKNRRVDFVIVDDDDTGTGDATKEGALR
jgi:outer membrane protein OmpA-like peptidoglycan-associated protein